MVEVIMGVTVGIYEEASEERERVSVVHVECGGKKLQRRAHGCFGLCVIRTTWWWEPSSLASLFYVGPLYGTNNMESIFNCDHFIL